MDLNGSCTCCKNGSCLWELAASLHFLSNLNFGSWLKREGRLQVAKSRDKTRYNQVNMVNKIKWPLWSWVILFFLHRRSRPITHYCWLADTFSMCRWACNGAVTLSRELLGLSATGRHEANVSVPTGRLHFWKWNTRWPTTMDTSRYLVNLFCRNYTIRRPIACLCVMVNTFNKAVANLHPMYGSFCCPCPSIGI